MRRRDFIAQIHQIQEALKRISEGTYGVCARCGEDIDPKRLKRCQLRLDVFHALPEYRRH
jgi:RNA polymerase-binding transcription factor DksA